MNKATRGGAFPTQIQLELLLFQWKVLPILLNIVNASKLGMASKSSKLGMASKSSLMLQVTCVCNYNWIGKLMRNSAQNRIFTVLSSFWCPSWFFSFFTGGWLQKFTLFSLLWEIIKIQLWTSKGVKFCSEQ